MLDGGQADTEKAVKEYLSTTDRFSERLRASMKGDRPEGETPLIDDQKQYFVDEKLNRTISDRQSTVTDAEKQ